MTGLVDWIGDAAKVVWNFVSAFGAATGITPALSALPSPFDTSKRDASSGVPSSSPAWGASSGASSVAAPADQVGAAGGAGPTAPGGHYANTIAGRLADARAYALSQGYGSAFAEFVASVGYAEGANKFARGPAFASTVDVDANGVPFSYGTYQLNMHKGAFGDIVRREAHSTPPTPSSGRKWTSGPLIGWPVTAFSLGRATGLLSGTAATTSCLPSTSAPRPAPIPSSQAR